MRRSEDGYVSATGMFKATFPYASAEEEELERRYIKSLPTTSEQETAGNLWISPEQALTLAVEYHILPWIQALLDPTEIPLSNAGDSSPPKKIAAPPVFFSGQPLPSSSSLSPPATMRMTRSRRSASPTKSVTARRNIASPRKRTARITSTQTTTTTKATSTAAGEEIATEAPSQTSTLVNGDFPVLAPPTKLATTVADLVTDAVTAEVDPEDVKIETFEKESEVVLAPVEEEPSLKVHVDQDTSVDQETGAEVTHTTVELELPLAGEPPSAEEAARMVAEAKAMVKAATEGLAAEKETTSSPVSKKSKRKADEIVEDEEADWETTEGALVEQPKVKKVKTEVEVKKDRIKRRALFGISATLAVG